MDDAAGPRGAVLLADDEPAIRKGFARMLEAEGFSVETVRDGAAAVEAFKARRHDLVLLDVMMPVVNGYAACEKIRALDAGVPVLFFTASESEAALVRGFGCGADDFIDKARSPAEFVARISAAVSRARARAASGAPRSVAVAGASVDFSRLEVVAPDGASARLSRSEADMLRLLCGEPGRVFSADEIFACLRGAGYSGEPSALRMLACRLRDKLGAAGAAIVSVRGAGYKFTPDAAAGEASRA